MIDQWPRSLSPVVQLWQSLCNSRPLSPHDWPCSHIQCGDHGKSMRAPPVPVCTLHDTGYSTHTHTLQNKDQRLHSSLVFIYVLFINRFRFLSCYLAHPSGQYWAVLWSPGMWKLAQILSAINFCYATQAHLMHYWSDTSSSWNENEWSLQSFFFSPSPNTSFTCYITDTFPSFVFILHRSTCSRVRQIIFFLFSSPPFSQTEPEKMRSNC